jgi:hypothetical protein
MKDVYSREEYENAVLNGVVAPYKGKGERKIYYPVWGFNKLKKRWVKIQTGGGHNYDCLQDKTTCSVCELDIENFGYPKSKYVYNIKYYINNIMNNNPDKKIRLSHEMFHYISKLNRKFLRDNYTLEQIIVKKIFEFRDIDNIKQSRVWYRTLFNKRMPINIKDH